MIVPLRVKAQVVGTLVVAVLLRAGVAPAGEIQWRSGPVVTETQDPAEKARAVAALVATGERRHLVVQFDKPILPDQRDALSEAGVTLQSYLGDNAFIGALALDRADPAAVAAVRGLVNVLPIERDW